ncbi:calcium-binding protein, partial [Methylobacterium sp. Leaf399]|uniref:calcium-binding protein n=1 Tax=Methylobacterium sp. Leaf399 TaxID=1736364 RepID=UPI00138F53BF
LIMSAAGLGQLSAYGDAGADNITAGAGSDFLSGGEGNDTLNGGAGDDVLEGQADNDLYYVDNVGDQVIEAVGGGTDRVLTSITYTLASGQEIERLHTTNDAGTTTINLTGNEIANVITGNAGANVLNGLVGADTMSGGAGSDTYYVDDVGDKVRLGHLLRRRRRRQSRRGHRRGRHRSRLCLGVVWA